MSASLTIHDLAVLLLEPSKTQQRIIAKELHEAGIRKLDMTASGREALAMIKRHKPDLMISSMYFEDMTGSDLLESIRGDESLRDLPFMLISSERHAHNLEAVRQAGAIAVLPKPFKSEDLQRALATSLDFIDPRYLELEHFEVEDLRVLLVDDSRFALRHMAHSLAQLGFEKIMQAGNGQEAAEMIRDHTFDLVITDYNMPEMDGEQLVNYIRQISDQPDLPILMVTSEQDQTRLTSVKQAGVSALCDKPFELNSIRGLLGQLLGA